jgi:hypothetical protein
MSSRLRVAFIGIVVLLAGCAEVGQPRPSVPERPAAPVYAAPSAIDLPCVQTGHGCIALNPDVTEASLGQTICVAGYTATVRPSSSYTDGVKAKLLRESGLGESHMADYELDHIVPLAIGGHPRKLSNLQLQPWHGVDSATDKDGLERRLQRLVCDRRIALADAQYCIAENWQACARRISAGQIHFGTAVVASGSPSASAEPALSVAAATPSPACRIKGNISSSGRIYHVPGSRSYESTVIDESKGERWFCSEDEARAAGWRAPKQ